MEVTPPKTVPESQPLKPMEFEINNQNNNVEESASISLNEKVPMIEVNVLENTPPSATSTPINLNSKPEPQAIEEADLKVVNKNFINSAVTGGNRYWTNQALQNDNSTKISQVDLVIIISVVTEAYFLSSLVFIVFRVLMPPQLLPPQNWQGVVVPIHLEVLLSLLQAS